MAAQKKHHKFRDHWKDYFSFSTRMKRGLIALFGLMSVEIAVLVYLHYLPASTAAVDTENFKKEIDDFYASVNSTGKDDPIKTDSAGSPENKTPVPGKNATTFKKQYELFKFNPNRLPPDDWKRLGLSDRQIKSINNYEAKGGTFRTRTDFRKMYAISKAEYQRLEPYIDLPDSIKKTFTRSAPHKSDSLMVDISMADQVQFQKLPMVGEYLAYKICNYREKLGGFYDVRQVKEVKGLRDSTYQVIFPHLRLTDPDNLRKINLNTADFEELNRHPYIGYALAGLIVSYRKQHGNFRTVKDLQKVALVDAELYRKIAPYLKVE